MQEDVFSTEHQKVGKIDLPDDIFGVEVNEALLWEQVKAQRASWRAGTHSTKTRADVSGGGIKPYKQKGTGRARQGSIRAPNHVGGGTVFGPHPRDYSYRLPRAGRKAALRSALSLRVKEKAFVVLDKFSIDAPRTKTVLAYLEKFGTQDVLIVDVDNDGLLRSTRNLTHTKALEAAALNVYDIMNHTKLVVTKAALTEIIKKAESTRRSASAAAA